jgi:uncharacterized membrane protein YcaP (DUF421 family)
MALAYLEILWRTTLGFIALVVLARISGKQLIAQLTLLEFIIAITIGSTASTLSVNRSEPFLPGLLGLTLWIFYGLVLNYAAVRSRRLGKIIRGEPTILIENGRILEKNLAKLPNFSLDDLLGRLRVKGVFDPSEVEFAVLELDGALSVLRKSQFRPVQPRDLNLPTSYEGLALELVYDGRIVAKNLKGAGLDEDWLRKTLRSRGIDKLSDVFLALLSTDGNLYVDLRDDQPIKIDVSDYERQVEKL